VFGVGEGNWGCFLWKIRFALTKINDTKTDILHKNHLTPTTKPVHSTKNTNQKPKQPHKQTKTKQKQHRHLTKHQA
jgi:hypothetical protein